MINKAKNLTYEYFKNRFETDCKGLINDLKTLTDMEQIKIFGFLQSQDDNLYKQLTNLIYSEI